MSKVKRGLQLSAAIVSIVLSSFLALGSIALISELSYLVGYYSEMITVTAFIMLFAIANIVVCSLLCTNPVKKDSNFKLGKPVKNSEHLGLTITALVLSGILSLLYITSGEFILMLMPLISSGLFVAVLCIPREKFVDTQPQYTIYENAQPQNFQQDAQMTPQNFQSPQTSSEQNFESAQMNEQNDNVTTKTSKSKTKQNSEDYSYIDGNIARITKLQKSGVLSAEEAKELILKELNKQK